MAGERLMAWWLVGVAVAGLALGLVEGLLSRAATGEPFMLALAMATGGNYPGVFVYLVVHNMGLAAVLPAFGLFFTALPRHRDLALRTLLACTLAALAAGLWVTHRVTPLVLAVFALECLGVLALAVPAYGQLRREARLAPLAPWCLAGFASLAAAGYLETLGIAGALPL